MTNSFWLKNNTKKTEYKNKSELTMIVKLELDKKFFKENQDELINCVEKEIENDKKESKNVDLHIIEENTSSIKILIMIKSWILYSKYNSINTRLNSMIIEQVSEKKKNEKISKENQAKKILYQVSMWTYKWTSEEVQKIKKKYPTFQKEILDLIVRKWNESELYEKVKKSKNCLIESSLNWFHYSEKLKQNIEIRSIFVNE